MNGNSREWGSSQMGSSRMGSAKGIVVNGFSVGMLRIGLMLGCCEWVRCWDVANGEPNLMGCEGESEGKREKPRKREM